MIYEQGIEADAIYNLNFRICVQLGMARIADHRRRRAERHGLVNVDFQLLADRVWGLKGVIDPFMASPAARSDTFIWTNLLDDFKVYECTALRLNKGKDVPHEMVAAARPG